jgi:hypothetical protein
VDEATEGFRPEGIDDASKSSLVDAGAGNLRNGSSLRANTLGRTETRRRRATQHRRRCTQAQKFRTTHHRWRCAQAQKLRAARQERRRTQAPKLRTTHHQWRRTQTKELRSAHHRRRRAQAQQLRTTRQERWRAKAPKFRTTHHQRRRAQAQELCSARQERRRTQAQQLRTTRQERWRAKAQELCAARHGRRRTQAAVRERSGKATPSRRSHRRFAGLCLCCRLALRALEHRGLHGLDQPALACRSPRFHRRALHAACQSQSARFSHHGRASDGGMRSRSVNAISAMSPCRRRRVHDARSLVTSQGAGHQASSHIGPRRLRCSTGSTQSATCCWTEARVACAFRRYTWKRNWAEWSR